MTDSESSEDHSYDSSEDRSEDSEEELIDVPVTPRIPTVPTMYGNVVTLEDYVDDNQLAEVIKNLKDYYTINEHNETVESEENETCEDNFYNAYILVDIKDNIVDEAKKNTNKNAENTVEVADDTKDAADNTKDTADNTKDAADEEDNCNNPFILPEISIKIGTLELKKSSPIFNIREDDNIFNNNLLSREECMLYLQWAYGGRKRDYQRISDAVKIKAFWKSIQIINWNTFVKFKLYTNKITFNMSESVFRSVYSSHTYYSFENAYPSFLTIMRNQLKDLFDEYNCTETEIITIVSHCIGMGEKYYFTYLQNKEYVRELIENKTYDNFHKAILDAQQYGQRLFKII